MTSRGRSWVWLMVLLSGWVLADVGNIGVVTLVAGDVKYASQGGVEQKVVAYMQVRNGDQFTVATGGAIRLIHLYAAREERWEGPARFRATEKGNEAMYGSPAETRNLPTIVQRQMSRVPELVRHARIGGLRIRGDTGSRNAAPNAELADAQTAYEQLRRAASMDDITPELFILSVLYDLRLYEEMKPVVEEMLRKQPESNDVRAFAVWMGSIGK